MAVALLIALTRTAWLPWSASLLVVNEPPGLADVVVVPSGQALTRVPKAAELLRAGHSRTLFTATVGDVDRTLLLMGMRVTDTELLGRLIDRERIPRDTVTIITGVTSTYEDALAFRDYARAHHVRSAILVTSHLHSRRARWTYRRVLAGLPLQLTTVEAPQSDFNADRWWQDEDGLLVVINEYLKFGFYFINY